MRLVKRILTVALCVLLLAVLPGCGSGNNTPAPTAEPTAEPAAEPTAEPAADSGDASGADAEFSPEFTFSTVDRDGKEWTEQAFAGHKLTMINFWEPWCPPCVGEMPDLELLGQMYAHKGFQILGVYSEENMESEVDDLIRDAGISYPLLRYVSEFDQFQSGYVPTTVFVDEHGHVLSVDGEQLIIGSNTLEGWSAIVEGLL